MRREGPTWRFVYIAIGKQAGDRSSAWDRLAKIDIHDLPAELVVKAVSGGIVEAVFAGRAKDGGPACATVRPTDGWKWRGA